MSDITKKAKKRVVIVGAGFGGLNAAKKLAKHRDLVDIIIIDKHNYHLFQPLLYQVAMAGLSPADIAMPIRTVFSGNTGIQILLGEVTTLDINKKTITTDFNTVIDYDYLILACGSQHSYFGHDEWESHAPGLKTLEQATEIRRRILTAFELAERETDPERRKELLTFIVVGGGPTGVELAGSIGEIAHFTLSYDFVRIDPHQARIILIEAGPRILPSFEPELARKAERDLECLGVTVWANTRVMEISHKGVTLGTERIAAATVLWAAGVQPSPLNKLLEAKLDKLGRVIVEEDLSLPGHPEVFVIGDQANFSHQDGHPLPGLAPVATQQGAASAKAIIANIRGNPCPKFRYRDKGQMATIGRRKAIAQIGSLRFSGYFAWLAWLFVHIYYLIGFKNRILVLFQWAWSYITFRRGAQLIVSKEWKSHPPSSH